MYEYRKIKNWYDEGFDIETHGPDDFISLVRQIQDQNDAAYRKRLEHRTIAIKEAMLAYGAGSRQVSYLQREKVPTPPGFKQIISKAKRDYDDFLKRQQRREYERDYKERREEAARALRGLGYIEGVNFELSNAISTLRKHVGFTDIEADIDLELDGAI